MKCIAANARLSVSGYSTIPLLQLKLSLLYKKTKVWVFRYKEREREEEALAVQNSDTIPVGV
jgi:hypothetical protein